MECQIRPARADDAGAISRVIIAALRYSNAQDYPPDVIEEVVKHFSPEKVTELLQRRSVLVAMREDSVVATVGLEGDVVRSLFVDPRHQFQGVGRCLMAMIESQARSEGVEVLRVPSSLTAEAFYRRLGYEVVREVMQGEERTLVMQRHLGPPNP
ncbi:Acetyltransferase, GNAT family [Pseudomonas delhiensis]|uniref:Acetyltransferase, GNAT family n=1 Tax=Pseudomonas delhiensis TaxID=366289 RepID=A0A239NQ00_9PSED|nr:GNAT family N-acetyltransferase [Pseudomonas delhiensis]SDL16395.1 Acetyltransferase, GNAT family [Pseudomonas delhiensis]SNT56454.1 Acetyltransferase, GNAT family [Pseudomonas delhiensis]